MKAFPSLCVLCGSMILSSIAVERSAEARPPVGSAITYQGELKNAGVPLNGTADLTFQLWPTASAVGAPSSGVVQVNNVAIVNGRFTVNLDFGAAAFNGEQRFMQIRVRTPHDPGNSLPFTALTPLQEAKPAPMAMHSLSTGLVPNASLVGTYSQQLNLSNASNTVAGNGAGLTALNASNLSSGVVGSGLLAGSYTNALNLSNSSNTLAGNGANISNLNAFFISSGNLSMARMPGSGVWNLNDLLRIDSSTLCVDPVLDHVGIGDVTPDRTLDVYDATQATIQIHSASTSGSILELKGIDPVSFGSSTYGDIRFLDGSDNTEANIRFSRSLLASGFSFATGGTTQMFVSTSGNVGIGTGLPLAPLQIMGGSDVEPGSGGILIVGDTSTTNITFDNNEIMARDNGVVTTLYLNNDGGDVRASNGTGKLITPILQITGGADLSEGFEISGDGIQPGMIVCIDPQNPGRLMASSSPYDPTVAGIISGAGGIRPGMIMSQEDSIASGQHPVALSGRVYCMADASMGEIKPGDLLTTSDVAGHAMKAVDRDRSHGTVIGKAMTGLKDGRGMVLVLVNLQ